MANLIYIPKGNERLQEMMGIMAEERSGKVFATDERSVPRSIHDEAFLFMHSQFLH